MSSSKNFVHFLFLTTTLLATIQTQARDIDSFNKVSRDRPLDSTLPNYNYHNHHEDLTTPILKQEQPQEKVSQNGYGLYGHETGLNPPSTTTTTTTTPTSFSDVGDEKYENVNHNYENFEGNGGVEKQGMSDTRYLESGKYYYDINDEKSMHNYHVTNALAYNNNFNNGDLDNKDNNGEYYYNGNKNYNGNGMDRGYKGYKNQFSNEEEFDFDDQSFDHGN